MFDGEEDKTMWVFLEEQFGGKVSTCFGFLVAQYFVGQWWRFGGFPYGRQLSGSVAELVSVVIVVTDEVRDLVEGLACDNVQCARGAW